MRYLLEFNCTPNGGYFFFALAAALSKFSFTRNFTILPINASGIG
jgi:hypothetical protein